MGTERGSDRKKNPGSTPYSPQSVPSSVTHSLHHSSTRRVRQAPSSSAGVLAVAAAASGSVSLHKGGSQSPHSFVCSVYNSSSMTHPPSGTTRDGRLFIAALNALPRCFCSKLVTPCAGFIDLARSTLPAGFVIETRPSARSYVPFSSCSDRSWIAPHCSRCAAHDVSTARPDASIASAIRLTSAATGCNPSSSSDTASLDQARPSLTEAYARAAVSNVSSRSLSGGSGKSLRSALTTRE
eukprot:scaffold4090_cov114-Isochrysis_galbana.AAC.3